MALSNDLATTERPHTGWDEAQAGLRLAWLGLLCGVAASSFWLLATLVAALSPPYAPPWMYQVSGTLGSAASALTLLGVVAYARVALVGGAARALGRCALGAMVLAMALVVVEQLVPHLRSFGAELDGSTLFTLQRRLIAVRILVDALALSALGLSLWRLGAAVGERLHPALLVAAVGTLVAHAAILGLRLWPSKRPATPATSLLQHALSTATSLAADLLCAALVGAATRGLGRAEGSL